MSPRPGVWLHPLLGSPLTPSWAAQELLLGMEQQHGRLKRALALPCPAFPGQSVSARLACLLPFLLLVGCLWGVRVRAGSASRLLSPGLPTRSELGSHTRTRRLATRLHGNPHAGQRAYSRAERVWGRGYVFARPSGPRPRHTPFPEWSA